MHYRKLKQALIKLTEEDCCSICLEQMPNGGDTFGGETKAGKAALVGTCCYGELKTIIMVGKYYASLEKYKQRMFH
jgi:hypothetical protein